MSQKHENVPVMSDSQLLHIIHDAREQAKTILPSLGINLKDSSFEYFELKNLKKENITEDIIDDSSQFANEMSVFYPDLKDSLTDDILDETSVSSAPFTENNDLEILKKYCGHFVHRDSQMPGNTSLLYSCGKKINF